MIGTILVPLDGSHFAEEALPFARWLAGRAGASLNLVLAHQPAGAFVGMGELVAPPVGLDEDLRHRQEVYLSETAEALGHPGGAPVTVALAEGPPGEAICEEAARIGADLIVMATHGRGALGRLWLGSVADHVVNNISRPAIFLHPGRKNGSAAHQIRSILVPLDFSAEAEAVLDTVRDLARLLHAQVTLQHVVEPHVTGQLLDPSMVSLTDDVLFEVQIADAERRLQDQALKFRHDGISTSTRVITAASAAAGILDSLEESFDLVAMTTHGRRGVRRLVLGSVADKVLRAAAKPVLMFRPRLAM